MNNVIPNTTNGNNISITGNVVDETGQPVIGATVIETGTTNGAVTDLDGNFSLEIGSNAEITVTCIGFSDEQISTSGRTRFTIVLKEDKKILEEVVVTAFATQKRVNVTGAITAVTGDDIIAAPVANVSSALVGITPGLARMQPTSPSAVCLHTREVRLL